MTTWPDFVAAEPELAQRVQALFAVRKHATLATVRADGAPRISGTEVIFADGNLYIGSMGGALKALDLRRDPRYALHCPTVDPPEENQPAWEGDAKLAGQAHEDGEEPGHENSHRFRLDVTEVVLTKIGDPADHLLIESWHPGRGRTTQKRY